MWDSFDGNINKLIQWVITQVAWAERELKGKSGTEKRAAVIKKIDDLIPLPFYLEFMDDMLIGYFVDLVCDKFNKLGKDLAEIKPDEVKMIESAGE